jgi:hypothetical protein
MAGNKKGQEQVKMFISVELNKIKTYNCEHIYQIIKVNEDALKTGRLNQGRTDVLCM